MERFTWTIAYRKRTANRFLRVTNWSGSWAQALAMAQLFGEANPDLQVWYTSSRDAELKGGVSAEDVANIMVDSGKRIRIVEGGELPAEMIARIPSEEVARERWLAGGPVADPVPVTAEPAPTEHVELDKDDASLLAQYEQGPRIWDATAVYSRVLRLEMLRLVRPIGGAGAYELTATGRTWLAEHARLAA